MDGAGGMSMRRHRYVMRNGIPDAYRSRDYTLEPTEHNLAAGERVYETNCASCHGTGGEGDGPAGKNLDPRPANIARLGRMPMAGDGYLYWTVAEGGPPVGSAMPAFGDVLSEGEIGRLLLYAQRM
jgi:mono/diheme cytochrome c family protein